MDTGKQEAGMWCVRLVVEVMAVVVATGAASWDRAQTHAQRAELGAWLTTLRLARAWSAPKEFTNPIDPRGRARRRCGWVRTERVCPRVRGSLCVRRQYKRNPPPGDLGRIDQVQSRAQTGITNGERGRETKLRIQKTREGPTRRNSPSQKKKVRGRGKCK